MFNKKVEVLNHYLSVVIDRPKVFVWRHKIWDSPSHDFLLKDGVHLNPCGQYLLYRSHWGAILKAVNISNMFECLNNAHGKYINVDNPLLHFEGFRLLAISILSKSI